MLHPAQLTTDALLAECTVRMLRRGGPGGQHRNKVETAVSIEHLPTGLKAEANERRSQADNRRVAIQRLRLRLAVEHRAPVATPDVEADNVAAKQPSTLWRSRVTGDRIRVSAEHDDFPAILAELLDHMWSVEFDLSATSEHFEVSSSQLVALLRSHPPALAAVNAARVKLSLHKLR